MHVTRYNLYWQTLTFWKGTDDEFDNKKNSCVGIDWVYFPDGKHLGGCELDQ